MFYSSYEIEYMSNSHGVDLRHSCENYKCKDKKKKSLRSFKLLQVLSAVILPIIKKQ